MVIDVFRRSIATGWTAPPIVAAIEAADDLTLVACVSRSVGWRRKSPRPRGPGDEPGAACMPPSTRRCGTRRSTSWSITRGAFWRLRVHSRAAIEAGVHAGVGSSGLTIDDYQDLGYRPASTETAKSPPATSWGRQPPGPRRHPGGRARGPLAGLDFAATASWTCRAARRGGGPRPVSGARRPRLGAPIEIVHGPAQSSRRERVGEPGPFGAAPGLRGHHRVVFAGLGERLVMRHDVPGADSGAVRRRHPAGDPQSPAPGRSGPGAQHAVVRRPANLPRYAPG